MIPAPWRQILRSEWRIVLLCVCAAGLGALITTLIMPPKYTATVHLQLDLNNTAIPFYGGDKITETWMQMVLSHDVLQQAATENGVADASDLAAAITLTRDGAQGFAITVTDTMPISAAQKANSLANALMQRQADVANSSDVDAQQQLVDAITATQTHLNIVRAQRASQTRQHITGAPAIALQAQQDLLQQQILQQQTALTIVQRQHTGSAALVQILKPAEPDYTGRQQAFTRNVPLSLLYGLLLGLGLSTLRTQVGQRVRDVTHLAKLSPWPVFDADATQHLSLGTLLNGQEYRHYVVTSAVASSDISDFTRNLGFTCAAAGKDTLLIDADLRRPTLNQAFNLPTAPGLTEAMLARRANRNEVAVVRQAEHLWVMSAGSVPPNPAQILRSRSLRATLVALSQGIRSQILLLTASVAEQDDVFHLAEAGVGVILVVNCADARVHQLQSVFAKIHQANLSVVGCVALQGAARPASPVPVRVPVTVAHDTKTRLRNP